MEEKLNSSPLMLAFFILLLTNQALLASAHARIWIRERAAIDMAPATTPPPADTISQAGAGADDEAQGLQIREGYRNVTIVYVAGIVVCLSIFALTYYIAYKTIFLRRTPASSPRWVPDAELLEGDRSGGNSGGLDAARVASLPVLQYASKQPSIKASASGSAASCAAAVDEEGDAGKQAPLHLKRTMSAKECAVCLSEFGDGENVRLLPVCGHCFHVKCIDMWLFSHTTCPICRLSLLAEPNLAHHQDHFVNITPPNHFNVI